MSLPICTICEAPWEPECAGHGWTVPLTELEAAAHARAAKAARRYATSPSARLASAVERNPEMAARYGVTP